mmetsp:Transcript_14011/g.39829  ORF Transcript_14011/g.39829 Transcript_14011/m.39829 type:complete len:288 (+) Transcript_14011:127-990(+)|eukprot:CAMPEP_0119126638 /NCGR_PEP_ID=MMETSP1310-20130426/5488_1 /TAXON_ID=464262 /ORGANISM="Genus nov. species nov., Strain RCC2339" /LENGTH=287 /DNA_ID=CAMNT_0007116809 /DNA_START=103 /DNA_END=966 /DNA_ORIENTATION=+
MLGFVCYMLLGGAIVGAQVTDTDLYLDYSYNPEDPNGPANWGSTVVDAELCDGPAQSPVNIVTADTVWWSRPGSLWSTATTEALTEDLENLQHTLEVVVNRVDDPSSLSGYSLLPEELPLIQYHFHAPSEHTIDGESFALEAHWYHLFEASDQASVIAVLYRIGDCDPLLDPVVEGTAFIPDVGDHHEIEVPLKPITTGGFFHYHGSATTPPCYTNVDWFISRQIRTICTDQLDAIVSRLDPNYPTNNRPLQNLNGRGVYRFTSAAAAPVVATGVFLIVSTVLTIFS